MKGVEATETKIRLVCAVCGKKATGDNTLGLPCCVLHQNVPTKVPICPNCDTTMNLKEGKNGSFWRCGDFPNCFGTRNLATPDEEPDLL